jgi:hypothetical protein
MNRLQIAQRTHFFSRIAGTGPTTTINQTSEYGKIVEWNDAAYEDIQRKDGGMWDFLRTDIPATAQLSSGTGEYTPTALNMSDLKNWILDDMRVYLTATGTTDEQEIFWMEWPDFRRVYGFGAARTQEGRPSVFTIRPDKSIKFWSIPDDTYTLDGEYYAKPDTMTADADETVFPGDDFDMLVVWRSLVYYGRDYIKQNKEQEAIQEYTKLLAALRIDQGLKPRFSGPLA